MKHEKPSSLRQSVSETYLSDRGIQEYIKDLGISEQDLDNPETVILDLGAGIEQNLAKEMRERSLRSKIISIDPRLGLSIKEDLSLMKDDEQEDQQKRIKNRKKPEPLTVAALSQFLPLKDNAVEHIYALYSAPYYLEGDIDEIKKMLHEAIRVVKPGGTIRVLPITEDSLGAVKSVLEKIKTITFTLTPSHTHRIDNEKDWLLIIRKELEK